LKFNIDDIKLT